MVKNATSGICSFYTMTSRMRQDPDYRRKKREEAEALLRFHTASKNDAGARQYCKTLAIIAQIEEAESR